MVSFRRAGDFKEKSVEGGADLCKAAPERLVGVAGDGSGKGNFTDASMAFKQHILFAYGYVGVGAYGAEEVLVAVKPQVYQFL